MVEFDAVIAAPYVSPAAAAAVLTAVVPAQVQPVRSPVAKFPFVMRFVPPPPALTVAEVDVADPVPNELVAATVYVYVPAKSPGSL